MAPKNLTHYLKSNENRQIDIDYHVAMLATNSKEVVEIQSKLFQVQAAQAAISLKGFNSLYLQNQETNKSLNQLNGGLDQIGLNLTNIRGSINQVENSIQELSLGLESCFRDSANILIEQRELLYSIAKILGSPYEQKVLELRNEADRWLLAGMNDIGRERDENFDDALRLFECCLENPIGMQDYVVWFQIGWLKWKHKQDLKSSELAFYRSQRLSKLNSDIYHLKSLRHLAFIQYLQNRFEEAYQTIIKAVLLFPNDHDTLYDAARYAAKTGREKESLEYLNKCIDERPSTSIAMFSEKDFL
jgi:tetratricopeptide (TPR) repeat protein